MTASSDEAVESGGELILFRRPTGEEPGRAGGTELVERPSDELVYDTELVDDDPPAPTGVARVVRPVIKVVQPVVVVVQTVRQHEPTVATTKFLARQVAYVFAGLAELLKRWWKHRTRYERYVRAAEAAGDREAMLEWEARGEQAKDRRHKRFMDLLQLPKKIAVAFAVVVVCMAVLLLLLGLAAVHEGAPFLDPTRWVLGTIWWLMALVTWVGGWLAALAPVLLLGLLWQLGRTSTASTAWVLAPRHVSDQATTVVTADGIVRALQKLGNSKLDKAFKGGWVPPFELPPTREGTGQFKGYRAIFGLPEGVTPDMVIDKADVFGATISRTRMETWLSDYGQEKGGRARYINAYIADRGVMDKPTPPYPLMHEGSADVFEGVPIGITQRGDMVLMPMNGSNFVFGGRPGQGKSNGVRVVVAGVALDPLAEIRVHVFAGNGDFDEYEPRLARYRKGASKEHAAVAVEHLEELLAEVERREYRLAELGAKKLTRAISKQHDDMRPLLVVFSECHEMFGDKEHGELAGDLAIQVAKRGRKAGVMLGFDTQSSRTNAIPSQLVENMGVNCCYSVKTWRSNDGFLGDGSFAAGIRATELRFNVDRGTMMTTGMTDELFELIRTYFIEVNDDTGWDAATQIIERAMEQIDPGTRTKAVRRQLAPVPEDRDLLEDIRDIIGGRTVPAADLARLLKQHAPQWLPYRDLDGITLRKLLWDEHRVRVPSTGNRWPVTPKLIADAIGVRQLSDGET